MDFFELDKNKVIPQIQGTYPDLWELAIDTNNYLVSFQSSVNANSNKLHEVIGVTLFIRCLTSYQALLMLASKGMLPQSQLMLRGLVEALFILVAISKDNEFAKTYVGHEEHQRKGVLNKLKRYKEFANEEDPDIKKATAIVEDIKVNIEENNIRKLSTEEISKVAGLHSWYDTVYAITSTAVHVSARTLESHLIADDDTGEIISFLNEPDIEGIGMPLGTGMNSMHIATDAICDILGREYPKENIELNERYGQYIRTKA